jgi:hypothetical protein
MESVRAALLHKALLLYESIGETDHGDDPTARFHTATANFQVGEIQRLLGMGSGPEKSEAAYNTAIQQLTKLSEEFPNEHRYRQQLGQSHMWLGELLREFADSARSDEAEKHYTDAIALQEVLAADSGSDNAIQHQLDLGRSHMNRGIVRKNKQEWDHSAKDYDEAERHLENALHESTLTPEQEEECRVLLAKCALNRGVLLHARYKAEPKPETLEFATAAYNKAIEAMTAIQNESCRAGQPSLHYTLDLAKYRYNLAVAYLAGVDEWSEAEKRKRLELAEAEVAAAVSLCESLNVGTHQVRMELALYYNARAFVLSKKQTDGALAQWTKAADVLETVWAQNNNDAIATETLAMIRCNICEYHIKREEHDEAIKEISHLSRLTCRESRYKRASDLMQTGYDQVQTQDKAVAGKYTKMREQFDSLCITEN